MNIEESVRNYERLKHNEQVRKWYAKNREKAREYQKKWRAEHPEKVKAYNEANREKRKAYKRERYRTNEGGFRDKQLAYQKARRLAQKERKENNG